MQIKHNLVAYISKFHLLQAGIRLQELLNPNQQARVEGRALEALNQISVAILWSIKQNAFELYLHIVMLQQ